MNHTLKQLSIGFSPCPNDTFMFDALINGKLIQEDFTLKPVIEDVEQLNLHAFNADLDVTKMSFFAYARASQFYKILNAGSALGKNCGPLLISKRPIDTNKLSELKIAIPGKNTTANLLLSVFYPEIVNKTELLFSEIENALLKEEFDAGLIIHENRFTYEAKGLKKIADLGQLWEQTTGHPIPLGCIAIKRSLNIDSVKKIDQLLKSSIEFAFEYPEKVMPFVKLHAQEMDENVMQQHINLYVNEFSKDLGVQGKAAINLLFEKAKSLGLIDQINSDIFA